MITSTLPILTVSQLNRQIKSYLEYEIGTVHVEGEISNLSRPSSGHLYFTLKDQGAQLRCVFFKNRHTGSISTKLADGQHLIAVGRLSLYEARGDYQLIVEQLEEAGIGALYQQFEALKNKLATEGLFHAERKKTLPSFPQHIGIITSPSGAAIQDMLSTLARRYPLAKVWVYPCDVQGAAAVPQLIHAVQMANHERRCDVLIVARGGGSIEDLWAFNDEQLARCIAASMIPVVSGVGHETDFTITDFVADYRAETPTAAAIAVSPDCSELMQHIQHCASRLNAAIAKKLQEKNLQLQHLCTKISSPQHAVARHWQALDYLERQLFTAVNTILTRKTHRLKLHATRLQAQNPRWRLQQSSIRLQQLVDQLQQHITVAVQKLRYRLNTQLITLHAVSPLATLDRGYAIARKQDTVLYSTKQVVLHDTIEVQLAKGLLTCEVMNISLGEVDD